MSERETTEHKKHPQILIVDDETSTLKLLKAILNRANYHIFTADNATEAIKLFHKYSFDSVITDAAMPGIDGYELIKQIRNTPKGSIPIIMLTRKRDKRDIERALDAGATDYILKPIDEHLILAKIDLCLNKQKSKRHLPQAPVSEAQSHGRLMSFCKIIFISETYLIVRVRFPVPEYSEFRIQAPLFDSIGIHPPLMRVIFCKEMPCTLESRIYPFEAHFTFLGVPEEDLRKIRNWINQEEFRRKK